MLYMVLTLMFHLLLHHNVFYIAMTDLEKKSETAKFAMD